MNNLNLRGALSAFCPIHHWRMAYDSGSSKVASSYRCAFGKCTARYSPSQGYFEVGKPPGETSFLSRIESIACQHDRDHHPCIVGYARESQGEQTAEWRTWNCAAEGCDFSTRQRLSNEEPAAHLSPQRSNTAEQFAFADR